MIEDTAMVLSLDTTIALGDTCHKSVFDILHLIYGSGTSLSPCGQFRTL